MLAHLGTFILLFHYLIPLYNSFSYQNPIFTPPFHSPIIPSILYDNVNNNNKYLLTLSMTGIDDQAIQIFQSQSPTDWIQVGWAVTRLPGLWHLDSKSSKVVRLLRTKYHTTDILLLVFSGTHQGKRCIGYGFTKDQDYTSFSINEVPIYCTDSDSELSPSLYQENTHSEVMLVWSERDKYGVDHVYNCFLKVMRGALRIEINTKKLLLSAGGSWEGDSIFSPQLFNYSGYYYLFYSGGKGNSSAIGVSRAKSFSETFKKFSRNPVITSDPSSSGWLGPSYPSVVHLDGVVTMFYQAVRSQTNRSSLLLDQLAYTDKQWFELTEVCGASRHWYPSTCRHSIP